MSTHTKLVMALCRAYEVWKELEPDRRAAGYETKRSVFVYPVGPNAWKVSTSRPSGEVRVFYRVAGPRVFIVNEVLAARVEPNGRFVPYKRFEEIKS